MTLTRALAVTVGYPPAIPASMAREIADSLGLTDLASAVLLGDSDVTHGQDVTVANTGHRQSNVQTFSGPQVIDQSWLNTNNGGSKTVTRFRFNGYAQIGVAGLRFVDCQFYEQVAKAASFSGAADLQFTHCTHRGVITPGNFAWSQFSGADFSGITGVTMTRGQFRGFGNGPVWNDGTTLVECFFGDIAPYQSVANGGPGPDGTHHSCGTIQFNTVANWTATRCKWLAGRDYDFNNQAGISGGLVIYDDSTHPGPITLTDCYMSGSPSFTFYNGAESAKPGGQAQNVSMTGTRWGREYQRFSGGAGRIATAHSGFTETGSTWGPRGPFWQSGDPEEGDPT